MKDDLLWVPDLLDSWDSITPPKTATLAFKYTCLIYLMDSTFFFPIVNPKIFRGLLYTSTDLKLSSLTVAILFNEKLIFVSSSFYIASIALKSIKL
jgi:hypothetical protein